MSDITVVTANGSVRGHNRGHSTVFYGIPYAEAPVGGRAFAPPARRGAWEGVRDATAPGPTAQWRGFDGGTIPEPSIAGDDVLTVNVFTPDPSPQASLPVLVWIHGGAYIAGSPISPWYDGSSFNRHGVVVVTVGYRLGVSGFGFIDDAPANRGVLDWLAALEWVRESVTAFGGDPERVTIAGQSAGGGAVLALLGIKGIESLASRAIAMSPVTTLATPDDARRAIEEVARLLDVDPTASALSRVSRETLANVPWRMRNVFGAAPGGADSHTDPVELVGEVLRSLQLSPTLDGDLVTVPLERTARSANGRRIPLLIGSVAQEFNGFVAHGTSVPVSDRRALELLGASSEAASDYIRLRSPLRGGALLGQVMTDLLIRTPVSQIAEMREHTWVYDFAWPGQGAVDPGAAFHCLDIPFAWGLTGTAEARHVIGDPPEHLAEDVHKAWVAFITNGDPGWEPYANSRAARRFDAISTTIRDAYAAERCLGLSG